jgi:hypothetical protein
VRRIFKKRREAATVEQSVPMTHVAPEQILAAAEPVEVNWNDARLILDRASECLFALRLHLSGVSDQNVRTMLDPVREESGATLVHIQTPGGILSIKQIVGTYGSVLIQLIDPEPEEERPPFVVWGDADPAPDPEPEPELCKEPATEYAETSICFGCDE